MSMNTLKRAAATGLLLIASFSMTGCDEQKSVRVNAILKNASPDIGFMWIGEDQWKDSASMLNPGDTRPWGFDINVLKSDNKDDDTLRMKDKVKVGAFKNSSSPVVKETFQLNGNYESKPMYFIWDGKSITMSY